MTPSPPPLPWGELVQTSTQHGFTAATSEGPLKIIGVMETISFSEEAAMICGEVAFRSLLDKMGVPWRTLTGDEPDAGRGDE